MIFGLLLVGAGYALFYYGFDVLRWAHDDASTGDPVTLAMCFGIPSDGTRSTPFMPPFNVGAQDPGTIHDAKGLLGGTTTATLTNQAQYPDVGNNVTSNTAANNADTGDGSTNAPVGGTTGQPAAGSVPAPVGAAASTGSHGTPNIGGQTVQDIQNDINAWINTGVGPAILGPGFTAGL